MAGQNNIHLPLKTNMGESMFKPQWLSRKQKSYSAMVLTLLTGITLLFTPFEVTAEKATEASIKRIEEGLDSSAITSLDDLANRLHSEQNMFRMIMPPNADFTLRQPCGMVVFNPKAFPDTFTTGLIGETIYGSPVYSLILIEDPVTRETVIANSDGKEIAAVKPNADYDPYWFLEMQYPDLYSGLYSEKEILELKDACDPSHIQITLTLLPADFVKTYARAVAEEQTKMTAEQAAAELKNPKLKKGGGMMMRYQSSGMTNLELVAIERATNGMKLTLAYPDGFTNHVDFFTCPELVGFWWDLATDATNVSSSTNFITWVDTNAFTQGVRFYNAGNADLDSDGDGIADAREKLMYHTNSSTNDTDGDGLHDDYEIFTSHTDPNNNDTNKPNAWITFPSEGTVEVWEP